MMTPQLARQLELNLTALCRGYRQALRHAIKTDPQGAEDTSAAWQTVAARQAQLLTMLAAVGPFLQPSAALPTPEPAPTSASPDVSAPLVDAPNEAPSAPLTEDAPDEDFLTALPSEILGLYRQILDLEKHPVHNRQQRRRQEQEIKRLRATMTKRYRQWQTDRAGEPPLEVLQRPS